MEELKNPPITWEYWIKYVKKTKHMIASQKKVKPQILDTERKLSHQMSCLGCEARVYSNNKWLEFCQSYKDKGVRPWSQECGKIR
jgi:hypothetical protein